MCGKRWRRWTGILAVLVLGIAVLWSVRGWILPAMGNWLDVGVAPQEADYALILGGDENARPFVAAALYKKGWVEHVLLVQGKPRPDRPQNDFYSTSEIIRRTLLEQGVPKDKFTLLPGAATNTFDEAQALGVFLESHPDARILIVTTHCHTRRASWIFTRELPPTAKFSMISAPSAYFELNEWWKTLTGWLSILGEYFKLAFYCLRYGYFRHVLLGGFLICLTGAIYIRYFRRPTTPKTAPASNGMQNLDI